MSLTYLYRRCQTVLDIDPRVENLLILHLVAVQPQLAHMPLFPTVTGIPAPRLCERRPTFGVPKSTVSASLEDKVVPSVELGYERPLCVSAREEVEGVRSSAGLTLERAVLNLGGV